MCDTIVTPNCPEYNILRLGYNRLYDNHFPSAIILPENNQEIINVLRIAQCNDMQVALRSGNHSYINSSTANGIITIDQRKRKNMSIDLINRTVTADSGVQLVELIDFLAKYNFLVNTGTCFTVGLTGLTSGGGIGFSGRMFGLTLDSLIEVEIILSNGKVIIANEKKYCDLFWFVRGSGQESIGVITKLKYKIYEVPILTIFSIEYNLDASVYSQWQQWILSDIPNNLTTELKLSNNKITCVGQWIGCIDESDLVRLINPILFNNTKVSIFTADIKEAAIFNDGVVLNAFHDNHSSFIFEPISNEGVDVIINAMKNAPDQVFLACDQMGGKYKQPIDKTSFYSRNAIYWSQLTSNWFDESQTDFYVSKVNNIYNIIRKFVSPFCYVNCPDLSLLDPSFAYYGTHVETLRRIKQKYNPNNLFYNPQPL